MSRITRFATAAGVGAVAASLALPGLALASTPDATKSHVGSATSRALVDNTSFAGYISSLGSKKTIVGTFTVPALDCGGTDEGIDTLVELSADAGASYVDGAVFSFCSGGVPTHNAVFDTTTDEAQVPIDEVVEDGDKITVTQEFKKGTIKITMKSSQGWTAKDSFKAFTPDEASVLDYSMTLGEDPLAPLSSDSNVTGVKVGGKALGDTKPTQYTLVDDAGKDLVDATKIKKGTDFKLDYVGK